jgi:hypothetical protein
MLAIAIQGHLLLVRSLKPQQSCFVSQSADMLSIALGKLVSDFALSGKAAHPAALYGAPRGGKKASRNRWSEFAP